MVYNKLTEILKELKETYEAINEAAASVVRALESVESRLPKREKDGDLQWPRFS